MRPANGTTPPPTTPAAPRWLAPLLTLRASPHDIALGASIGVFVAFTPTFGVQMLLAAAIATMLRTSRPAAMIPVWISNPITMGPIYAFTWYVGTLLSPTTVAAATRLADPDAAAAPIFDYTFTGLFNAGTALIWPLTVGGVFVGLVCALITYPAVKRAAEAMRGRERDHGPESEQRVE